MNKTSDKIMFDSDLIAACGRNEIWAQRKLYEYFAPKMFSVCVRFVGRENARDVLQDGFIRAFAKISEFRNEGVFEGWLRKIFISEALHFIRNEKYFLITGGDYFNALENNDLSIFEKLSADDLHKIISELPAGFRTVFNLYAVEGYSHKEIGKMLNIQETTSRSQYQRARVILQEKVKESYEL